MPLSSTVFTLNQKIKYFPIFIFCTYGANVSMAMFLESRFTLNNSEAFSYKHVTYIKERALFTKINFFMWQKIRLKWLSSNINVIEIE